MTLPEVKAVKFEAADPPADPAAPKAKGARKVIVLSDQAAITQDDAVNALGKKAKRYVVRSWTAPSAEEAEAEEEATEG